MPNLSQSIRDNLLPETIVDALSSPQRAERCLAVEHLQKHMFQDAYRLALITALQTDASPSPLLLDALSSISTLESLPLFDPLVRLLDAPDTVVGAQAARVLARCFSQRCSELRPWFGRGEIRFECCFSGDPETAQALMEWYVEQRRVPDIAFGLLLTPAIVFGLANRYPDHASGLTRQFGYSESNNVDAALPLLGFGTWCVPAGITSSEQRQLEHRTEQIVSELLALLNGQSSPDDLNFDPYAPLDLAALYGAVRRLDHQSFVRHKFENRLHPRQSDNIRRALCKHAPIDFCNRILVADPLRESEQFEIPAPHQGRYLLEHAAVLLTNDTNLRVERKTYLKSRWAPRPGRNHVLPSRWTFPVEKDSDAPELKYRVVTSRQLASTRIFLEAPSAGALAAARLLQSIDRNDLIESLFAAESRWGQILSPIGIEVQIPFSARRESESLAWKQALRALQIPSPRRPEYRMMVEVAFPPSRSYLPQVLLPLALEQLGLFQESVDMALHLSFSGELGEDVRYLLMAQQLINEPMVHPRPTRLARLMSKGFAHVNQDALPLDGVEHHGIRTELRSYRFGYKGLDHSAPLERQWIDDIIETSLLVAAKQSSVATVSQVWAEFGQCIREAVRQLPAVFTNLLDSDWYAATGDPHDEAFSRRLPISQAWIALKTWISSEGRAGELRQQFRELRRRCAAEALLRLNGEGIVEGLGNQKSHCGASYFDPSVLSSK